MFFQVLELETHDEEYVFCIKIDVDNFIKQSIHE